MTWDQEILAPPSAKKDFYSIVSEQREFCTIQIGFETQSHCVSYTTVFKHAASVPVLCATWKRACVLLASLRLCSFTLYILFHLLQPTRTHAHTRRRARTLTTNWLRLKYLSVLSQPWEEDAETLCWNNGRPHESELCCMDAQLERAAVVRVKTPHATLSPSFPPSLPPLFPPSLQSWDGVSVLPNFTIW